MSNDLIITTAGLPDYIRELGGYVDEGLAAGVQARAPKFGITIDKAFTVTYEGQTIILQGPDGYPVRTVTGVIIAASDTLTKAWYEKTYEAGSFEAPDCFSNDGKVPAAGVAKPQCSNCASCPRNAFGSHPVTGRGKACADRKMIVLVLQNEPDKLLTFNVPTMSLQSLAKLNGDLKGANIALQSVAVQFSFDMSKTYSVVKIGTVGFIGKESFLKYKTLAESDEVRSMLREVDYEPPAPTQEVVPNNEIAFGTAGKTEEPKPEVKQPTAEEVALANAKAAYEAALAAAAGGGNAQSAGSTGSGAGDAVSQTANVLNTVVQANDAGNAAAQTPAPAKRHRRTKAEIEAARLTEAGANQQQSPAQTGGSSDVLGALGITQVAQQADHTVVATQPQQTAVNTGGAPAEITDLLAKWKTA
jgi:hypothetical protein